MFLENLGKLMQIILKLFSIVGSLGMFLFGMKIMSDGIQKAAGEKLHGILNFITNNRFASVFTGFLITAIIQSSSATTVMVVSFVNAGLLSLVQSIGVIMGANIGTTVTAWIVAYFGFKFKIAEIALPVIAVGIIFFFAKKWNKKSWGEAFIGFGILFLGLANLKNLVPQMNFEFVDSLTGFGYGSIFIFVFIGALITVIVHSSSASVAIIATLLAGKLVSFELAAAMALGSNIGTTIDAYLASIGTTVNARRAARVHLLFNIAGTLWVIPLLYPFLSLVDKIIPGVPVIITGSKAEQVIITTHLAMFHTLFNCCNTLLFIGFVPQIAKLIKKIIPEKKDDSRERYRLKYISTIVQDTPELNIINAKRELSRMAGVTEEMFITFLEVFRNHEKKMTNEVEELKQKEDYTDQMQEEISRYLVECAKENLNEVSAMNVNAMIRIVNELESIGDSCFNLIVLLQRRYDKKIKLYPKAIADIEPYARVVKDFIFFIKEHLNEHLSSEELDKAYILEESINNYRNSLIKESRLRLQSGSAEVKGELLYLDMLRHIERIGDYSLNVAEALRAIH